MNSDQVDKFLEICLAAYPNMPMNNGIANLWDMKLSDVDEKLALDNLHRHIDNEKFPPTIADIKKKREPGPYDGWIEETKKLTAAREEINYAPIPQSWYDFKKAYGERNGWKQPKE